MKNYLPRISDAIISEELAGMGAVLVQGAKWCGKTTSCEQLAKSVLYMADPKKRALYLQMAENDITELLNGEKPRLIDEWQDAPQFWDAVRFHVDHADDCGQFILTGSAVPPKDNAISHSGTGRIARVTMRPMSLWESGESSGSVSLKALFDNVPVTTGIAPDRSLRETAALVCRGGWPRAVLQGGTRSLRRAFNYYDSVVNVDIQRADNTIRDPERVKRLMRSYARLQGTQSGLKAIKMDVMANDSTSFDEDTVSSYVKALKKIFVIEDMPAWCPNLRNKAVVRTSDTRYFTDPSIAVAALGASPDDLMNDLATFGFLFETMAIRDLRCYAEALDGSVYHYHDGSGLECDAVIHLRNGSYGLVEVKLGGETLIGQGVATLHKLAAKIDPLKMKPPSFLMVLVATGEYAVRRSDGILVAPIASLRP
jgi:predicted AAA+ superfamily ATPase